RPLDAKEVRMKYRMIAAAIGVLAASVALTAQTVSTAAKAAPNAKSSYVAPNTPWGDPDLPEIAPAMFNDPMSRPANLKDKDVLSDAEFEQAKAARAKQSTDTREQFEGQVTINPPSYWSEGGTIAKQTSLVVDPPDGRQPAMTAEARKIVAAERGGLGP